MDTISLTSFLSCSLVQMFLAGQLDGDEFRDYFSRLNGLKHVLDVCPEVSRQNSYFSDAMFTAIQRITSDIQTQTKLTVTQSNLLLGMADMLSTSATLSRDQGLLL